MGRSCPLLGTAVYLDCLDCEDKQCKQHYKETGMTSNNGRKIIFIWEHEINDDWFWVGDYFEV